MYNIILKRLRFYAYCFTKIFAGIYFIEPEITPHGQGTLRAANTHWRSFSAATEFRALLEGQFLAKLYHARKLGFQMTSSTRMLATGGATANEKILQVSQ